MNALRALATLALLQACAPRPVAAVEPAPVAGAEQAALHDLAEQLETGDDELSARAAELARVLARSAADPEVRRAAVELVVAVRDRPGPDPCAGDTGEVAPAPPEPDPAGLAADRRALEASAPDRLSEAREALRLADYSRAIALLEPLRDTGAWERARPFWEEAVDQWVASERERAGMMYVAARRLPRDERRPALLEVREILAHLLDTYPTSAYAEPLEANLARVERELELLE